MIVDVHAHYIPKNFSDLTESGMVPMYLLMSAFHSAPLLRLVSSRRSSACRS